MYFLSNSGLSVENSLFVCFRCLTQLVRISRVLLTNTTYTNTGKRLGIGCISIGPFLYNLGSSLDQTDELNNVLSIN